MHVWVSSWSCMDIDLVHHRVPSNSCSFFRLILGYLASSDRTICNATIFLDSSFG
uniref:Uncharacterized protein n=1 Tax=Anguilla anguilla TaxID=7936 RepID=A0A0E9T9E3_ANGAN